MTSNVEFYLLVRFVDDNVLDIVSSNDVEDFWPKSELDYDKHMEYNIRWSGESTSGLPVGKCKVGEFYVGQILFMARGKKEVIAHKFKLCKSRIAFPKILHRIEDSPSNCGGMLAECVGGSAQDSADKNMKLQKAAILESKRKVMRKWYELKVPHNKKFKRIVVQSSSSGSDDELTLEQLKKENKSLKDRNLQLSERNSYLEKLNAKLLEKNLKFQDIILESAGNSVNADPQVTSYGCNEVAEVKLGTTAENVIQPETALEPPREKNATDDLVATIGLTKGVPFCSISDNMPDKPAFLEVRGSVIHIGHNQWIAQAAWTSLAKESKDSKFVRNLAYALYGDSLKEYNATGRQCNKFKEQGQKKCMSPEKISAIKDLFVTKLKKELQPLLSLNSSEDLENHPILQQRLSKMNAYIANKSCDLKKSLKFRMN
ncbi:uncharacterized protein LOC124164255 [Ischnura elegans]|uniref:uncharacterized protein LOC124164255 n=1 Tax=Ischnura elegans TaxID=197161 RepID=UPI001ED88027|nr:uncharacterized protein LOC124164255 [Ischnura elegans]